MNKKFKGQGALEYLLLIGGAVLIAVIVIALLVGMGGQSRDTAQEQADKAQQATDVPQPAQIVAVESLRENCVDTLDAAAINFSWRPIGEGGVYELIVTDSQGDDLNVTIEDTNYSGSVTDLDPNNLAGINITVDTTNGGTETRACGDTYYMQIKTTKNNQSVTSGKYKFSWSN